MVTSVHLHRKKVFVKVMFDLSCFLCPQAQIGFLSRCLASAYCQHEVRIAFICITVVIFLTDAVSDVNLKAF